jgi:SAM-dependent methyltransferase
MESVRDHYAKHLSPIYSWMVGGVEAAMIRGNAELDALGIGPPSNGKGQAVDLGAGFGAHSIPLARRGFSVLAVDTSAELLAELRANAAALPIKTINTDILAFRGHLDRDTDVVLCMGDTLAHLASVETVDALFDEVAAVLPEAGLFVLTFRDYSTALAGNDRFIPVRNDADRILTCFLEYEDAHVTVHDVLYEREQSQWKLRVSSYRKLRLAPDRVIRSLEKCGFQVARQAGPGGMVRLAGRRA